MAGGNSTGQTEKHCNRCGATKPVELFYRKRDSSDGRQSACKECHNAQSRKWRETHPDRAEASSKARNARWRKENAEYDAIRKRQWEIDNPEKHRAQQIAYRDANRERIAKAYRTWRIENREARADYARNYRNENRNRYRENARNYYARNQIRISAAKAERYRIDPFARRESASKWRLENREKRNSYEHARRARLEKNGVFSIRKKFIERLYRSACAQCGSTEQMTMDHVVPISRGGSHSEGNLMPLCRSCNMSKKDKLLTEWRMFLKRRSEVA